MLVAKAEGLVQSVCICHINNVSLKRSHLLLTALM